MKSALLALAFAIILGGSHEQVGLLAQNRVIALAPRFKDTEKALCARAIKSQKRPKTAQNVREMESEKGGFTCFLRFPFLQFITSVHLGLRMCLTPS